MRTWPITVSLLLLSSSAAAQRAYERRVFPDEIEASSTRANQGGQVRLDDHVNFLSDDDPSTAWTEGDPGSGAGESFAMRLPITREATRVRLRVRAGCPGGDFAAHPRPRQVTLTLSPGGARREVELADRAGWQDVVVEQPAGPVDGLSLAIDSVRWGTSSTELCVTDVLVLVTSTEDDEPRFGRNRKERLMRWSRRRVEAARVFAQGGTRVPLLPAYEFTLAHGDDLLSNAQHEACMDDDACATRALVRAVMPGKQGEEAALLALAAQALAKDAELTPVTVLGDPLPFPAIDGFAYPELEAHWDDPPGMEPPLAGGIGAFTVDGLRVRPWTKKATNGVSASAAEPDADGRRAFVIERRGKIPGRLGEVTVVKRQVLVYGSDGRLRLVASRGRVGFFTWGLDGGRTVIVGGEEIYDGGRNLLRARRAVEPGTT